MSLPAIKASGSNGQRNGATRRLAPLSVSEYERDFRESASDLQLIERVYQGGLASNRLRAALWPYLFGLMRHRGRFKPLSELATSNGSSAPAEPLGEPLPDHHYQYCEHEANIKRWDELERLYHLYESQWKSILPDQELRFSTFRERKALIERDVERSDRTHPFYSDNNQNLAAFTNLLMTYMMYDFDIGYLQGMSDLAAPILFVFKGNLVKSFWVFVEVMKLFRRNFEFSQKTIHFQLNCLFRLIKMTDPKFAQYLRDNDCSNCFFAFRCIVCQFKRELTKSNQNQTNVTNYDKVLSLWDTIWSVQRHHELLTRSRYVHTFTIANGGQNRRRHQFQQQHRSHLFPNHINGNHKSPQPATHNNGYHSHSQNQNHTIQNNNNQSNHTSFINHHNKSTIKSNNNHQDKGSPTNGHSKMSADSANLPLISNGRQLKNAGKRRSASELNSHHSGNATLWCTNSAKHSPMNKSNASLNRSSPVAHKLLMSDRSQESLNGNGHTNVLYKNGFRTSNGALNNLSNKLSNQNGHSNQHLARSNSNSNGCNGNHYMNGHHNQHQSDQIGSPRSQNDTCQGAPVKQEQVVYTKETFYSSFDPNQADVPRFELTETEKFVLALCLSLIRRDRNQIMQDHLDASEIHQHFINPHLESDLDSLIENAYHIYNYMNTDCDLKLLVKGANEWDLSPNLADPSSLASDSPKENTADTADTYDLLRDYLIISPYSYDLSSRYQYNMSQKSWDHYFNQSSSSAGNPNIH